MSLTPVISSNSTPAVEINYCPELPGLIAGWGIVVALHGLENGKDRVFHTLYSPPLSDWIKENTYLGAVEWEHKPLLDRIVDTINTPLRWAFGKPIFDIKGNYSTKEPSTGLRLLGALISVIALPILLPFQCLTMAVKWRQENLRKMEDVYALDTMDSKKFTVYYFDCKNVKGLIDMDQWVQQIQREVNKVMPKEIQDQRKLQVLDASIRFGKKILERNHIRYQRPFGVSVPKVIEGNPPKMEIRTHASALDHHFSGQ